MRKDTEQSWTATVRWAAVSALWLALLLAATAEAQPSGSQEGETPTSRDATATGEDDEAIYEPAADSLVAEPELDTAEAKPPDPAPVETNRVPAIAPSPPPQDCPECPALKSENPLCQTGLGAGPRFGGSVNTDQWTVGGHLRLALHCLGGLTAESYLLSGWGGNYATLRPGLRLSYFFWFTDEGGFAIYPTVGGSLYYYLPVGHYATWCNRHEVDACWSNDNGFEVGGGVQYSWFGLEGMVGLGGLPVVTINATLTVPLLTRAREKTGK
ncbi:MAG: hypothetical protein VB934_20230 [Polyangiaceae bacterium]